MLFNIKKQTGLALLQITMAVFILLAPSLFGLLPISSVTYLTFAAFCGLTAVRVSTKEKINISVYHVVFIFLAAYAVLSSLWVNNREGQLIYLFAIGSAASFYSVAGDYFAENSSEGIRRRIMYMLSFSGLLCSIINIVYWILYIVTVAGSSSFKQGIGSDNFLSIFTVISVFSTFSLMKGNSKLRRTLLFLSMLAIAFVFVMAKSVIGWAFAVILIVLGFLKKKVKSERSFTVISLGGAAAFTALIICVLASSAYSAAFADVFSYGSKNIFGAGGGFWSGKELFSTVSHTEKLGVGLLAYSFAASGIPGLLCCICIAVRSVIVFLRLKTVESLVGLMLYIAVMLLPFGENLTVILLWIGLAAYNEHLTGKSFTLQMKKKVIERTVCTVAVLIIIAAMLFILSVIRLNAYSAYKNKDYASAYSLYKTAATVNLTDSESCRMAAASIRKSRNLQATREEAIALIDSAIKRDSDNLKNLKEKALIYDACGEYELSVLQYRDASQKAAIKDEYNLSLAKELYKIVKKSNKGSSETKRAYEEIVSIAQSTENLDLRKEINDIADKALIYTKEGLSSEG